MSEDIAASPFERRDYFRARQIFEPATNGAAARRERLNFYYEAQGVRPPRYEGQLEPAFQRDLTLHHATLGPEDCDFYHSVDLPDGRTLTGAWDLRRHEDRYLGAALLGHKFLRGKTVAEFGPATGALTAHMAKDADEVTVFDLPFGAGPELVPHPEIDMDEAARSGASSVTRLRNGWWYVKAALGYEARAVYADIYHLPRDLPRFDVAVFGALLLHLSNPFRALQQAAALVDDALIVTEVNSGPAWPGLAADSALHPAVASFNAGALPSGIVHWWSFGPRAVMRMVERLGFEDVRVDMHVPPLMAAQTKLFTVTGRRRRPTTVAVPRAAAALPVPPPEARFLVAGTDRIGEFLELGSQGFEALARSLTASGIDVADAGAVLDFGCGVGRVLRYWADYPKTRVYGTDYQTSAIAWCAANLPFATVATNTLAPSLSYEDGAFDVIYALSVFTHLPEEVQVSWLRELLRVLKPGGVLYFTVHGEFYSYLLDEDGREAFGAGRLVVTGDDLPGTNFCAAFHPPDYVMRAFVAAHGLTLVEHVACGARGNPDQDSYLVRKGAGGRVDG